MKRSTGNLGSCHRHDRQTVLPQQALKPEHSQAEYRMNGEKGGRERQRDCEKLGGDCENLWVYIHTWGAHLHRIVTVHAHCTPTSLSAKEVGLDQCCVVLTFVRTGRFRFLHYVMKPDHFSNLYVYIYICLGLWEPKRFSRFLFFPNSTASQIWWFLHNIITIDFHNPVFILFAKYCFFIIYSLNPRPVTWRKRRIVVRPFFRDPVIRGFLVI